jgi:hypothetical protein
MTAEGELKHSGRKRGLATSRPSAGDGKPYIFQLTFSEIHSILDQPRWDAPREMTTY